VLSVDKDKKKIALSIKRAEVDPWTTVEQRYTPGQVVTGVITKIAPFGAFARIEDGIEGLIHLSELTPGMDPKQTLHEGVPLQLRILRIDAERRRLGLSLRQADEPDAEPVPAELTPGAPDTDVTGATAATSTPSLENLTAQQETSTPSLETSSSAQASRRNEGRNERQRKEADNTLLSGLASEDTGETTAMAEAFRAAARQRSKEENETPEE
jgi:small subunit ribosomal protein S1